MEPAPDSLTAAALEVRVFEVAERIMVSHRRGAIGANAAETLALAWATHRLGKIAEASAQLVAAMTLPPAKSETGANWRQGLIDGRLRILNELLLGLTPAGEEPQPDGESE